MWWTGKRKGIGELAQPSSRGRRATSETWQAPRRDISGNVREKETRVVERDDHSSASYRGIRRMVPGNPSQQSKHAVNINVCQCVPSSVSLLVTVTQSPANSLRAGFEPVGLFIRKRDSDEKSKSLLELRWCRSGGTRTPTGLRSRLKSALVDDHAVCSIATIHAIAMGGAFMK